MTVKLDGRWCDTAALCDHRLGFTFARGERGYRSVAGPATDGAPFGTRAVSAPVDVGVAADARAREAQRQGGYAQLAGDAFVLRDGIGEDGTSTTQALAFSADGTTGFTGGTVAFGAATAARAADGRRRAAVLARRRDRLGRHLAQRRRARARDLAPGRGAPVHARPRLDLPGHAADADPGERSHRAAARDRLAAHEPDHRRRQRRGAGGRRCATRRRST